MAQSWRQYQEDVAAFFRSLGFNVAVDHDVEGVRSNHKIDVWVDFEKWGWQHRWVVECKRHTRPITKADVEILKMIVGEVGASLGFLVSESGFQSGAFQAARKTNVILSSLDELRTKSADDLMLDTLVVLDLQALRLRETIGDFTVVTQTGPGTLTSELRDGVEADKYISMFGSITMLDMALDRVRLGNLPVVIPGNLDHDPDSHIVCATVEAFALEAKALLERVESWAAAQRPE